MSACHTWPTSSQFWLEPTTMKRKRRDNVPDVPPTSSKRRRKYSHNIEDGFAYLSLNGNSAPYYSNHATNYISVEEIPPPVAMDTEMSCYPSQPPYTVEEPPIPEINMKTSSWFEPERDRIIITDLDSFTQSDDEDEQQHLTVNAVLLEKIRGKVVDESISPLPSTSQALVLFRPPPWANAVNEEVKRGELKKAHKEVKIHPPVDVLKFDEEDMAMEVEL